MSETTLTEKFKMVEEDWITWKKSHQEFLYAKVELQRNVDKMIERLAMIIGKWTTKKTHLWSSLNNILRQTKPDEWSWYAPKDTEHYRKMLNYLAMETGKEWGALWDGAVGIWRKPKKPRKGKKKKVYIRVLPAEPYFESTSAALTGAYNSVPKFLKNLNDRIYFMVKRARSFKQADGSRLRGQFVRVKFYYKKPGAKRGTFLTSYIIGECDYKLFKGWKAEGYNIVLPPIQGLFSEKLATIPAPPPAIKYERPDIDHPVEPKLPPAEKKPEAPKVAARGRKETPLGKPGSKPGFVRVMPWLTFWWYHPSKDAYTPIIPAGTLAQLTRGELDYREVTERDFAQENKFTT